MLEIDGAPREFTGSATATKTATMTVNARAGMFKLWNVASNTVSPWWALSQTLVLQCQLTLAQDLTAKPANLSA